MTKLYPHQKLMVKYCLKHDHPALFVSMRLGKTKVAVRVISSYESQHVLIVAPYSAFNSWIKERPDIIPLIGTYDERMKLLQKWSGWYIINKEGFLVVPEIANYEWGTVVLDESTFVKTPGTQVSRFFCKHFRNAAHRWILTGTPAPETPLDYFQQFKFLDGGRTMDCDNYYKFRFKWFRPAFYDWKIKPEGEKFLARRLAEAAFTLDRKQAGYHLKREYVKRIIQLPDKIRKMYDTASKEFLLELESGKVVGSTLFAMTRFIWLRLLCSGIAADRLIWNGGKYRELVDLLQGELRNEQVVVFCDYQKELSSVSALLLKKKISFRTVYGAVEFKLRPAIERDFQAGKHRVMLAQPECYKFGADLSAASTMIYFSSPLSSLTRQQSECRIESIKKKETCLYIDFVCEDTVEEDILEAHRLKLKGQQRIKFLIRRIAVRRELSRCTTSY